MLLGGHLKVLGDGCVGRRVGGRVDEESVTIGWMDKWISKW